MQNMAEQDQGQRVATWWQPDKTNWTVFTFVFPNAQAYMVALENTPTPAAARKKFDAEGVLAGREPFTGSPLEIWNRPNWIARPTDPMSEGRVRQDPDK